MQIWTESATRLARGALPLAAVLTAAALVGAVPVTMGMSWSTLLGAVAAVSTPVLAALAVLWLLGLLAHTVVLTAALPGLTTRRALLLNLSGSAVSNLVPFGGAAGMGLGYVMARTWKISPTAFASFTVVSNLWNVLGKLAVGAVLGAGAVAFGMSVPPLLHGGLVFGSTLMLVVLGVISAIAFSPRAAAAFGRGLDRILNGALTRCGSSRRVAVQQWVVQTRAETSATVSDGWIRLTAGVIVYLLLQAVLLAACLAAVGAHLPWIAIAVAFGIERLLTLIPLTPGGSGFTELGTVAVLVALGGSPVPVAAGVLLYRLFTFLVEIPVGGVSALLWLRSHRVTVRKAALA